MGEQRDHWEKLIDEARSTLRKFEDLQFELRDYERKRNEIIRMYSTGQVSREVFDSLMSDLRMKLFPLVRSYFELKGKLKDLEGQLQLAVTRLSVETKAAGEPYRGSFEIEREQRIRQVLNRLGGALENVRAALKGVNPENELRLFDVILDELVGKDEGGAWKPAIKEVLDAWSRIRLTYASKSEEMERQIEQLNDSLRELEVRFLVGEFDRAEYETRRSALEKEIGELQSQLEGLQERLEDLDLIAARCRRFLESG